MPCKCPILNIFWEPIKTAPSPHAPSTTHDTADSPASPAPAHAKIRESGRGGSDGKARASRRNPPCGWGPS